MIESGEKPEEYREIKPYWIRRLCRYGKDNPEVGYGANLCIKSGCLKRFICEYNEVVCTKYDYVCFHYGRTAKTMVYEVKGIFVGNGEPKWGAPENEKVFVIQLGYRII